MKLYTREEALRAASFMELEGEKPPTMWRSRRSGRFLAPTRLMECHLFKELEPLVMSSSIAFSDESIGLSGRRPEFLFLSSFWYQLTYRPLPGLTVNVLDSLTSIPLMSRPLQLHCAVREDYNQSPPPFSFYFEHPRSLVFEVRNCNESYRFNSHQEHVDRDERVLAGAAEMSGLRNVLHVYGYAAFED